MPKPYRWRSFRYRFVPWLLSQFPSRAVKVQLANESMLSNEQCHCQIISILRQLSDSGVHSMPKKAFSLEMRSSSITGAGQGLFVRNGKVPSHSIVALYPGTVYAPGDPILLQSLNNCYILCCADGYYIDGKSHGLSKLIYKSCVSRDTVMPGVPAAQCDWLQSNVRSCAECLCLGQIVNNAADNNANVAYQEHWLETEHVHYTLRQHLPNIEFQAAVVAPVRNGSQSRLKTVVLVSLREIAAGEELLSSYFTLIH